MSIPLVLLIHSDSEAQDEIVDALGDEFEVVAARNPEQALRLIDRRLPAVAILETDLVDRATQIYAQLSAKGDVRAIFLVDPAEPRDALTLTGLGTVLPKGADLDRLRAAVRRMVRLQAMSAGVEALRTNMTERPPTATDRPAADNSQTKSAGAASKSVTERPRKPSARPSSPGSRRK